MAKTNFKVKIAESSRELSPREMVKFKDTQNAISIYEFAETAQKEGVKPIIEDVKDFVVLDIHNDKSDDKDYKNFVIINGAGDKYVTGSTSFWNSFVNIHEEMKNETEAWSLGVNLLPSKNYKGKFVLTCSLI